MVTVLQSLFDLTSSQDKLLASGLGLALLIMVRLAVMRFINRQIENPKTRYTWRKNISYISVVLCLILGLGPWIPRIGNFSTFLGLTTAGFTVVLREPIVDMLGWLFLLWRQPFHVGDRIEIGTHAGDVIDIRTFQFTLMEIGNWVEADQSTGRIIHIPNSAVFRDAIANYSQGFRYIRNELSVLITFESDWQKAKQILTEIANDHAAHLSHATQRHLDQAAEKYLISYSKLTPIVYTSVQDSGVQLTVRYLCKPRQRRGTEEAKWEAILTAFAQESNIHFAYPTQRFYTESSLSLSAQRNGSTRESG